MEPQSVRDLVQKTFFLIYICPMVAEALGTGKETAHSIIQGPPTCDVDESASCYCDKIPEVMV